MQSKARAPSTTQVYAPGFTMVLDIPTADVHHMPSHQNVSRLVLCANYDARNPASSCAMHNRCKFVHANVARAREHSIHVNYAWRSLTDVTYERFVSGQALHVAPPNSKVSSDVMDSDMALKTKALASKRRPLSHCAHYYFNRTCNLGAECQFVHAVFIDPSAKDHQRAPVPSQLGEGRELQLSKKQREQRQREAAQDAAESVARPQSRQSLSASFVSDHDCSVTPRSERADHEAHLSSSASSSEGRMRARFRHDPYSTTAVRVVTFPHL
jgi:hypothetical protein